MIVLNSIIILTNFFLFISNAMLCNEFLSRDSAVNLFIIQVIILFFIIFICSFIVFILHLIIILIIMINY